MAALHLALIRADVLIERLAELSGGKRWFLASWLAAATAHAGLAFALARLPPLRTEPPSKAAPVFELEPVATPIPEPPPRAPDPPQEQPSARAPTPNAAPRATPAARAAPVLQQSEPGQPVDFTDEIVSGTASSFSGGATTSAGTSPVAVRTPAAPAARVAGAELPGAVDLSRAASVRGGLDWRCPFPPEAESVNRARATIRVDIDASGRTLRASVVSDPGHGFGRAATRCARDKRWSPALDRAGKPVASSVVVAVRFVR